MIKVLNLRRGQVFKKTIAIITILSFMFTLIPFNPALVFANETVEQNAVSDSTYLSAENGTREVPERRTETSKTFDNGNGKYTSHLYSAPIHFKEDGQWKDIDNTIKASDVGFGNKANRFKVRFGEKGTSPNLTSFEYQGFKVTYALTELPSLGAKYHLNPKEVIPKIEKNVITLENIFPGVDLRQTVLDNELKEDIVLNEYNGKNSFVFSLKTVGVDAVKEDDGSISFYKKGQSSEKVFSIPKPFMIDSNINKESGEAARSDNVTADVVQYGANTYITITADEDWLKSTERVYPVYIDPTTNLSDNGDTFVMSAYPTTNYNTSWNGSYYELKTGYYNSTTGTNYSFIKFDTTPINGKLVTAATLKVYCAHSYYATTSNGIWLDTVNGSWSPSTLNWSNKPSSTALTSTNTVRNTWTSFNVTTPVAGWASSPAKSTNNGFKLHTNGNGQSHWKKFYSMENSTNKPYIAVTYSEPPGGPTGTVVGSALNSKSGYVNLSWAPVAGATGYKVLIFNGKEYQEWNVGNVTSWSTQSKKIWPTTSEITAGRYLLHSDGLGTELADNPSLVYKNAGTQYANYQNYWFRVQAYSSIGQTSQSPAWTPKLPDRTPPPQVSTVGISGTNGSHGSGSASVTATWTGVTDSATGTGYGTKSYKVELIKTDLKTNAVTTQSQTITHNGAVSHSYTFTGQPDYTKFQIKVTTYDNNGNYSSAVSSTTWNSADRTNPTATISNPLAGSIVGATVVVKGQATDDVAFGSYKIEYGAGSSPTSWVTIPPATTGAVSSGGTLANWNTGSLNGTYTLRLTVTDAAGNSLVATRAVTVDNTVPVASIDTPSDGDFVKGIIDVEGSAKDTTGFKDYKLEYGVGSSPTSWTIIKSLTTQVSNSTLGTWNTTALTDGVYTLRLTVTDILNRSKVASVVVTKDATPPTASITSPINDASKSVAGALEVKGSASDTNIKSWAIEYGAGSNPTTWTQVKTGTSNVSNQTFATLDTTTLTNGVYTVRLKVNDKADNVEAVTSSFTVDNTSPTVSFLSPTSELVKDTIDISASISDNFTVKNMSLVIKKYGSNYIHDLGTKSGTTLTWNWNSLEVSDGEYILIFKGTDQAGNETILEKSIKVQNLPSGLGTESYWASVDNSHGIVNAVYGNFTITETDFSLPGRGLGTEITRIYNSQSKNDGVLGIGWKLDVPELSESSDGTIQIIEGDGSKLIYTKNPDGTFNRPAGKYVILSQLEEGKFSWKLKDGKEFIFDQLNKEITLSDRNANTLSYKFRDDGKLISITDSLARNTILSYREDGKLESITDHTNRTWLYDIDTSGNLKITNPKNQITSYRYDLNKKLNTITDARGYATTFIYKGEKIEKVINAKGSETVYGYYESTNQFTVKDGRGYITTYKYNDDWTLNSITDALNGVTSFNEYDEDYNLKLQTNAGVKTISYTYDSMGNLKTETNQLGKTTTYTYYPDHNLETVTNPLGEVTTYLYDINGNLENDGSNTYKYKEYGVLEAVYDGKGNVTTHFYDSLYNLDYTIDGLGNKTDYEYNARGHKLNETDANGNSTSYKYDVLGFLETVTSPNGELTSYTYDANGNRETVTDAAGNVTTWKYDELNRVKDVIEPGNKIKSFTYDPNGNITTETSPDGKVTSYLYTALNLLEEITYPDGKKISYSYDSVGNRKTMTDSQGITTYDYYDDDKLKREITPSGKTTTYTYDDSGRLKTKTVNGKTVTYNFNGAGNLETLEDSNGGITDYDYDANNNRTDTVYSNNTKIKFGFDNANRLNNVANYNLNGSIIHNVYYTHWDNNQIKTVNSGSGPISYKYDGENRLEQADYPSGKTTIYGYDTVGNRTYMENIVEGQTYKTNYKYDPNGTNQLQYVYRSDGSQIEYTYDSNGRTRSKVDSISGITYYEYNSNNQLTKVTKSNADTVEFAYDGDNKRVSKSVYSGNVIVTTKYEYDGELIAAETDKAGNIKASYVYDDKGAPVSVTIGTETYYFHYNGHGDVVALTNTSGTVVATYEYDEWGNVLNKTGNIDIPFGYAGQFGYVYDKETGLYFLKSRFYDPEIGRFTTKDRFMGFENRPASQNPYTYSENDPINNIDPEGYYAWVIVGAGTVGYLAYKLGLSNGLKGWKLAMFTAFGAGIGGLVGNAMTPLLKPMLHVFINWGKAVGLVSMSMGYKIMVHWPHHGKGIHIALQRLTQSGNWRLVWEKILWK